MSAIPLAAAQARLWYWQRVSAMVLALCVLVHLARHRLRGARRPERRRDSRPHAAATGASALFYAVFVLACAVHVPIGLASILRGVARLVGGVAARLVRPAVRAADCWCWGCARCMGWCVGMKRAATTSAPASTRPTGRFWCTGFPGLALALFLPLHFWALGQAIHGEAALDGFLRFTDQPLFKFAEWGLVVLLALHMTGGVRLLLIEFGAVVRAAQELDCRQRLALPPGWHLRWR